MKLLDHIAKMLGYEKARHVREILVDEFEERLGKDRPENYEDYAIAYGQVVWVYACVSTIATAIAGVPLRAYRKKADAIEEVSDSRLARLLSDVNPHMSSYDLWEATASFLELSGNCYWEIEKDEKGVPSAIYPMRPDRVKIVPDRSNFVMGYIYEINGRSVSLEADEVVHFRYFNPANEYYGLGPISAIRNSIIVDQYSVAYNKAFFKNGAHPGGVLETSSSLSDETFNRLRKQWEEGHKGSAHAHRIAVLEEGLSYKPIGLSPRDMEFLNQRKFCREEICATFKVPPALVGVYEYANYANAEHQNKAFWQKTIIPKLRKLELKLDNSLLPKFASETDGADFVRFDTSAVDALKENENVKSQVQERLVRAGIMTINEVRRRENLPPVTWGDSFGT
ncbi:MAG: phage portal protein [Candidatus Abyssobacteria bacterium SURF_5]|uniref:Phage portal protein n=1 Tax=Abyssobacteria bacterium (strain SURF_5) TaxID=2093360 RepID=A0A3A4N8H9_ABYX5|nr:MAG: phage portal protein [Candidatus Abyssubacteria bacterium SURF_5]